MAPLYDRIRSIGPFLLPEKTANKKTRQFFLPQIWAVLHFKNSLKENQWSDLSENFCALSLPPFVNLHKLSGFYLFSFIQKPLRTTNLLFGNLFWILSYKNPRKMSKPINPSSRFFGDLKVSCLLDNTSSAILFCFYPLIICPALDDHGELLWVILDRVIDRLRATCHYQHMQYQYPS